MQLTDQTARRAFNVDSQGKGLIRLVKKKPVGSCLSDGFCDREVGQKENELPPGLPMPFRAEIKKLQNAFSYRVRFTTEHES